MSDLIYNQTAQNSINIVSDKPSVGIHVPDTNVGELISRQAAIDSLLELDAMQRVSWKDAVIDMLDGLPSIQPRKGKWEIYGNRGCCSECHKFTYLGYDFNFCPNCGADMREGDAE